MSLVNRYAFAILLAILVLATANVYNAKFQPPQPHPALRGSVSAPPALAWNGSYPTSIRSGRTNSRKGVFPPSFLPIQLKNPQDLAVGKLLVANRDLADPNFAQTVVLLIHSDENNIVGLVLNRRTDVPLSKVLNLEAAKDRTDPIYLGGPVEPSAVVALFQPKVKINKAENLFGGVYLINDKLQFEQIILSRPDPAVFHVYAGYTGWTPDQLRAEVQLGAWFIFPADADTVFNSDPDSLWPQMIQKTELKQADASPATSARHDLHVHSEFRSQREDGLRLDMPTRSDARPEPLSNGS